MERERGYVIYHVLWEKIICVLFASPFLDYSKKPPEIVKTLFILLVEGYVAVL